MSSSCCENGNKANCRENEATSCDVATTMTSDLSASKEHRLICVEVETLLQKIQTLKDMEVNLPANEDGVIDCRLLKALREEDAEQVIRDTFSSVRSWLDRTEKQAIEHVNSHRFVERAELQRDRPGRSKHETKVKEVDSGIHSERLSRPIQESNDNPDGRVSGPIEYVEKDLGACAKVSSDVLSFVSTGSRHEETTFYSQSCDVCMNCQCHDQTPYQVRRGKVNQGGRRNVITSVSALHVVQPRKSDTDQQASSEDETRPSRDQP